MGRITNILLVVLLTCVVGYAQGELYSKIKESFSSGNASTLSDNFGNSINCNILGKENFYSRSQSAIVFKDFFTTHKPKDFEVRYSKNEKNGGLYLIGKYTSQGGKVFRITIYAKQENETEFYIIKIKIEE